MLLRAQEEKEILMNQLEALKIENEEMEREIKRQNERGWPNNGLVSGPTNHQSHLISNLKAQVKSLSSKVDEKEKELTALKRSAKFTKMQELDVV